MDSRDSSPKFSRKNGKTSLPDKNATTTPLPKIAHPNFPRLGKSQASTWHCEGGSSGWRLGIALRLVEACDFHKREKQLIRLVCTKKNCKFFDRLVLLVQRPYFQLHPPGVSQFHRSWERLSMKHSSLTKQQIRLLRPYLLLTSENVTERHFNDISHFLQFIQVQVLCHRCLTLFPVSSSVKGRTTPDYTRVWGARFARPIIRHFATPTTSLRQGSILHFFRLFGPDPLPSCSTRDYTSIRYLHCCSALLQNLVGNSGETQCLEESGQQAVRQVSMLLVLLFKLFTQFRLFALYLILSLFSILSLLPLHHPFFLF